MMVFLVAVDMPELLPLLLPWLLRLAVGVDTVSEVELLTEPSDWVTTTTVVEVVGVGVAVVEDSVDVTEVVGESLPAADVVELGVAAGLLVLVGVVASSVVEVGVGVVAGSVVEVEVTDVVSGSADEVVVSDTVDEVMAVLTLPLEPACL